MQKVKVLVVDDNKRIVSLLKDVLSRDEQMQVVGTAGDGEEDDHISQTGCCTAGFDHA